VRPQVSRGIRALLTLLAFVLSVVIVFTPSELNVPSQAPGTPVYLTEARAYVVETATPGYTMTLQGAELAIGRLHPEFVVRLANAIREARGAGLPFAGVFSAYRPPAFGIGAFSDKFHSLHSYGLAVDVDGIGRAGSFEAQLWHEIAARNGVICPYGPNDRAEWNHCQPTSVKVILAENPLRETISAAGPFELERMFEAGDPMIESIASAAESLSRIAPTSVRSVESVADNPKPTARTASSGRPNLKRNSRATERIATKSLPRVKLNRHTGRPLAVEEGRQRSNSGRG
jgi:hypothetical protein